MKILITESSIQIFEITIVMQDYQSVSIWLNFRIRLINENFFQKKRYLFHFEDDRYHNRIEKIAR